METNRLMECALIEAEKQLRLGRLEQAKQAAHQALQQSSNPSVLGRGYSVVIQSDFQMNRLTNLEQTLQHCGHEVQQLPVPVILLWGVVGVELQEADTARVTLSKYLAAMQCAPKALSREDAMAISRLYAVQLLANSCHDFSAAAAWLEAGGAGLSHEQQELLLLEVEEAEELLQEQHLAEWASTHAAAAADSGGDHPIADLSDAHASSRDAHSIVPCASTGGGSTGGAMGSCDLGPAASGVSWESTDQQQLQHVVQPLSPAQQQHDKPQQQVLAQGQHMAAPPHQPHRQQQQQQQQQQPSPDGQPIGQQQQMQHIEAGVRTQTAAVAEAIVVAGHQDEHLFCTITGLVETEALDMNILDESGEHGSFAAASPQSQQHPASTAAAEAPAVNTTSLDNVHSIDSASTNHISDGRDQSGSNSSVSKAGSSTAVDSTAHAGNTSDVSAVQQGQAARASSAAAAAEQQSWLEWMNSSGSRLWGSAAVQGTLQALNMQDVPPYEVVAGAALATVIGYSVYRERKALRRAAAHLAAGIAQTAQMALGFGAVNPMAAVPQAQYRR